MYVSAHPVISSSTGDEFIKHASKSINEKTFLINFSRNNLEKDLSALDILSQNAMILYVHNSSHNLSSRVLREILQNREIACFIVDSHDERTPTSTASASSTTTPSSKNTCPPTSWTPETPHVSS